MINVLRIAVVRSVLVLSLAGMADLSAPGASVTLDFASSTQGFANTGNPGGTLGHSPAVGSGSIRLSNPAGWVWRGVLDVNSGSTGTAGSIYTAFTEAGLYGGKMRFDLILTSTAATGTSGGFGGVSYLLAVNQDSANGGGWDQLIPTNRPASGFPVTGTITIPVEVNLVPTTNTPVSGSDSVLSVRNGSSWYQIQLGTTANSVSSVEWYVDNFTIAPNSAPTPPPISSSNIVLEAESGMLVGTTVSAATAGYSGTGYVTGFDNTGDAVRWSFPATNGFYQFTIRYRTPWGQKGFAGLLNGAGFSGTFPATNSFASFDAGFVELVYGTNVLEISGGWNWYEIDRVDLVAAASTPPLPVPPMLSDSQATFATRVLMEDLAADYGKVTWSGQQDASEIAYVFNTTGRKPAIISGDFMDYSPSRVAYGGMPANYTESMIALENAGHVLAMCWHWNAPTNLLNTTAQPWWRGFYTEATTFDVAAALADTNSPEYVLILRDIDAIAVQIRKFANVNIPILWRPLHEAEGGWFWWGARGASAYKQLWRLLHSRLTTYHELHNMIWVLTSEDPEWYPGDDVVDIIGVDGYPPDRADVLSTRWEPLKSRFDGRKMIALSEFGGVPDIERMHRFGVWFAYFAPWGGTYGPSSMPTSTVVRIYQSPEVVTLDELNSLPPRITAMNWQGGALSLAGKGPRGAAWRLYSAAGLPATNWSLGSTGKFAGGVFTAVDWAATNEARFYRLLKP